MVSPLYSLSAFAFALVLIIILLNDRLFSSEVQQDKKTYRLLFKWVIFFCLQDTVWGICASDLVTNDLPLFVSSTVFHLSTVLTTFFWLYYILSYLGERIKHKKVLLAIDGMVVIYQVVLLAVNVFYPVIFHVTGGQYYTDLLRPLAFFNQYVVYLAISISTGLGMLSKQSRHNKRYLAVFFFSLAPVLTGFFQYLYPDGPFYSMGYFFGCFIIHIFVVARDRDELIRLHNKRQISEQTRLANHDQLTSLLNRHAYEADMSRHAMSPSNANFAYIALDINGLKTVNDTIGHKAGDELIMGTADCMRMCLGSYGKLYRIGGDEFAALIYATKQQLDFVKKDLEETTKRWHGNLVKNLSISVGIVSKQEFPDSPVSELAVTADERMYEAKGLYYKQKGIDRHGQQAAFAALCATYTKILKINVTTGSYSIIRTNADEQTPEMGFAPDISKWMHDFGITGQVHPDDLDQYLSATDLTAIADFFRKGNTSLNIFYRRKYGQGFIQTKMEMIPAEDYTDEDMNLYLYVK